MKQSSTELIERIFGLSMTDTEITSIPNFETGETILNISGDRNIHFQIQLTKDEDKLFTGGV